MNARGAYVYMCMQDFEVSNWKLHADFIFVELCFCLSCVLNKFWVQINLNTLHDIE